MFEKNKIERLQRQIEKLKAENAELKAQMTTDELRELYQTSVDELQGLIAEMRELKVKYNESLKEMALLKKNFKKEQDKILKNL